ncbi:TPA: hypothetical protein ACH6AG_000173 [Campylobacter jejuni]
MNFDKLISQVERFKQEAVRSSGYSGGNYSNENRPYNLGFITEGTHKVRILLDQGGEWSSPATYYHNIKVPGSADKYKRVLCADQFSMALKRSAESCPVCREVKLVYDYNDGIADEANKIKLGGYNRYTREKIYKVFLYLHETTAPSDFWTPGAFHVAIVNTRIWTALKSIVETNVEEAQQSPNPEEVLNLFNYQADHQPIIQLQIKKGAGGSATATLTRSTPELKLSEKIQADQLPILTQVWVDSVNGLKPEELARGSEEVKQIFNQQVVMGGATPQAQTAQPAQVNQETQLKGEPSPVNTQVHLQQMNEMNAPQPLTNPSVQPTPEIKPEVQAVNQPAQPQQAPTQPTQSVQPQATQTVATAPAPEQVAGDKPSCYTQFNPTNPNCVSCNLDTKRQCIVDTARKKSGM